MSTLTQVTEANYQTEVVDSDLPVLIDFYSPWCRPCKAMEPILDELNTESETLKIVKVDASEESNLVQKFSIQAAPTYLLLQNGELLAKKSGMISKEALTEWVEQNKLTTV